MYLSAHRQWIRGVAGWPGAAGPTVTTRTNSNKCADINVVIIRLANRRAESNIECNE